MIFSADELSRRHTGDFLEDAGKVVQILKAEPVCEKDTFANEREGVIPCDKIDPISSSNL